MTTIVTISAQLHNQKKAVQLDSEGQPSQLLKLGESATLVVYPGRTITISEVDAPAEDDQSGEVKAADNTAADDSAAGDTSHSSCADS